jgi:N-acetyl-gamma-glutamyl-phosphate/LysW-gamma-L-alpha-aminoadipyl-6-phosphate reductase
MIRVAIAGAAGYVGGELLRLLLDHPEAVVVQAASESSCGRRVDGVHPNLRGHTDLTFCRPDALEPCDALLLATPHGKTMRLLPALAGLAKHVIDLSADFRLRDPAVYARYYGADHAAPELLGSFVTGLPEVCREQLRSADRIAVPGCSATAAMLGLWPLAAEKLIEPTVLIDARSGSSGAGVTAGEASLHAERSGVMRVFAPLAHRHEAEVAQLTGLEARLVATAVEAVRGVQVVCHARAAGDLDERALRQVYRDYYTREPFIRIVAQRRGTYRYPEPKILLGSNYCDIGFAVDPGQGRVVVIAAIDNLMKGAAGNAVQCLNVRTGCLERAGLRFAGLHPI